jgi:hypothetical protein
MGMRILPSTREVGWIGRTMVGRVASLEELAVLR